MNETSNVKEQKPARRVDAIPSAITRWIENEKKRHRFWRNIWSVLYFGTAAATVVFGALTTASAGLFASDGADGVTTTTTLAAVTTILASLEKVLRLREKWDLHRNIQVALELIEIRAASGLIDTRRVVQEIERVARLYSEKLSALAAPTGPPATDPGA